MPDSLYPISGYGALLSVNDGASQVHVQFDDVVMFTFPSVDIGKVESTTITQTTRDRNYVPTMFENGALKCEINWTKANYARLVALKGKKWMTASVQTEWKTTSPDPDGTGTITTQVGTFNGFVTKIDEVQFDKDSLATIKFEVTVTSAVTLA